MNSRKNVRKDIGRIMLASASLSLLWAGSLSALPAKIEAVKASTQASSLPTPDCSLNGLYGSYYNLPATHTDVEGAITGIVTGKTPFQYDWYSIIYFGFNQNDAITTLNVASDYFPIPNALPGDPFYFAVHWTGRLHAPIAGTYNATLGSDDDAWLYVNGDLKVDLGGVHAFDDESFPITLGAGTSTVDLYFAERHVVQSGIKFTIDGGVTFTPCLVDPNLPPYFVNFNPPTSATATEAYSYDVEASDPENDTLTFSLSTGPSGMAIDSGTGVISWIPSEAQVSTTPYAVTVDVSDGVNSTSTSFSVTVNAAPTPPPTPTPTPEPTPPPPTPTPTPPPSGGGGGGGGSVYVYELLINNGDAETATTSVSLRLSETGANEMFISNESNFASGAWEPFLGTKPWVLPEGNGEKIVYAKFRGPGSTLPNTQDSIRLHIPGAPGTILGATNQGQVLGAATTCGPYLLTYIKFDAENNQGEVSKLQQFLNEVVGSTLPITGYYGVMTRDAVNKFQTTNSKEVLRPWIPHGHPSETEPTGYVYKTTKRWINMIKCPTLNLSVPELP